ncbi:MAG: tRNA (adenosine(37)-N6)-threonylcarbamoyltransferase complex ATPase subunit type 1 TsaE [Candidatus Omnitrophota bacterium]
MHKKIKIISNSPNQTLKIGNTIAEKLKAGDIVCLFGELGSGKTQLAKGMLSYFDVSVDSVNSPSFVLLKQYPLKQINLNHFDLFRLEKEKDILAIGFLEYVYSTDISIIEWADRLKTNLPNEFVGIELKIIGEDKRQINLFSKGERYLGLVKILNDEHFSN